MANFEKAVEDKYKELSGCGVSVGVECEVWWNWEIVNIIFVVWNLNSGSTIVRTLKKVNIDEYYRSGDELVSAIVFESLFC